MTLGRAVDYRFEQLWRLRTTRLTDQPGYDIDEAINDWLDAHAGVEIVDIRYTSVLVGLQWRHTALVIYREPVPEPRVPDFEEIQAEEASASE